MVITFKPEPTEFHVDVTSWTIFEFEHTAKQIKSLYTSVESMFTTSRDDP